MFEKIKKLKNDNSGSVTIIVAFASIILIMIVAMTVDYGYMAYQKSYLQNAADYAALAGAIEIYENTSDSEVTAVVNEYANSNNAHADISLNITTNINRTDNSIEVYITQVAPSFFSSVFSEEELTNAYAKAICIPGWDGEALPFVNLDNPHSVGSEIEVWEKTGPGDFESLWKDDFEIIDGDDPDKTYFNIFYDDGLTVTKGVVANIKQEVGYVYDQEAPAKNIVNLFSLTNDAINSGQYNNIKNKDVILSSDLVLLQVSFDYYDQNQKKITVTVLGEYDFINGDYPPGSGATAKLIN